MADAPATETPTPTRKKKAPSPGTAPAAANGEKKPKAKRASGPRGPIKYSPSSKVVIITPDRSNPKRQGSKSYDRFELYSKSEEGMTVKEALDAGVLTADIGWDYVHNFISIDGETAPPMEKKERKKKEKPEEKAEESAGEAAPTE